MSANSQDNYQWLSVTEATLFLHDGLIHVTDLIVLPHDVNTVHEVDHEVITFDSKSPSELSQRLKTVCGTQNNAYSRLLEYRLNALRGFWNAQRQISLEEQNERESCSASHDDALALLKRQGFSKEPDQAPFSTRVSLLLVLPLLQSQSRIDIGLCGMTAELLLSCLRDVPSLSLTKEPSDCLNGLESLLSTWLGDACDGHQGIENPQQRENVASALVALTCARYCYFLLARLASLLELYIYVLLSLLTGQTATRI